MDGCRSVSLLLNPKRSISIQPQKDKKLRRVVVSNSLEEQAEPVQT